MNRKFASFDLLQEYFQVNFIIPFMDQGQQERIEGRIYDALWMLYRTSDTIATEIDKLFDPVRVPFSPIPPPRIVHITYAPGDQATTFMERLQAVASSEGVRVDPNVAQVYFDPDSVSSHLYFDNFGCLQSSSIERSLAHELWHALTGQLDPQADYLKRLSGADEARRHLGTPDAAFRGETVDAENIIGSEIGEAWVRAGYFDALPRSIVQTTFSRTEGNEIGSVFVDNFDARNPRASTIDFHLRLESFLLLTLGGDDKIFCSDGSDYIYAGDGDDTIYGSGGSDFIDGGDFLGNRKADGRDVVDYYVFDGLYKNRGSISVLVGVPGSFDLSDDEKYVAIQKSQGGSDKLVSIEKIIGTGQQDSVEILSFQGIDVSAITINLDKGFDTLDLSGAERNVGGYNVNLFDLGNQYASWGNGPQLHLRNVDDVVGSTGNDNVILPRPGQGKVAKGSDPLILDLDGNGIDVSQVGRASPLFDIDGDGWTERTAWVAGNDGLLARDLDGDQKVTSVAELFGSPGSSGFAMLADLDDNHDGVVDASDAVFASLRVWVDANHDAVTDTGELKTLAELGITAISIGQPIFAQLAADLDGDGSADIAAALTGNLATFDVTFQSADELAQFDANGDGVFDAGDAGFDGARVWVDANGDGIVDDTELQTLADLGVTSIGLEAGGPSASSDTIAKYSFGAGSGEPLAVNDNEAGRSFAA